jgi:hypothetical protein
VATGPRRPTVRTTCFAGKERRIAFRTNRFAGKQERFAGKEKRFTGKTKRFAGNQRRFAGKMKRFAGNERRFAFRKPRKKCPTPPRECWRRRIYRPGRGKTEMDGFTGRGDSPRRHGCTEGNCCHYDLWHLLTGTKVTDLFRRFDGDV